MSFYDEYKKRSIGGSPSGTSGSSLYSRFRETQGGTSGSSLYSRFRETQGLREKEEEEKKEYISRSRLTEKELSKAKAYKETEKVRQVAKGILPSLKEGISGIMKGATEIATKGFGTSFLLVGNHLMNTPKYLKKGVENTIKYGFDEGNKRTADYVFNNKINPTTFPAKIVSGRTEPFSFTSTGNEILPKKLQNTFTAGALGMVLAGIDWLPVSSSSKNVIKKTVNTIKKTDDETKIVKSLGRIFKDDILKSKIAEKTTKENNERTISAMLKLAKENNRIPTTTEIGEELFKTSKDRKTLKGIQGAVGRQLSKGEIIDIEDKISKNKFDLNSVVKDLSQRSKKLVNNVDKLENERAGLQAAKNRLVFAQELGESTEKYKSFSKIVGDNITESSTIKSLSRKLGEADKKKLEKLVDNEEFEVLKDVALNNKKINKSIERVDKALDVKYKVLEEVDRALTSGKRITKKQDKLLSDKLEKVSGEIKKIVVGEKKKIEKVSKDVGFFKGVMREKGKIISKEKIIEKFKNKEITRQNLRKTLEQLAKPLSLEAKKEILSQKAVFNIKGGKQLGKLIDKIQSKIGEEELARGVKKKLGAINKEIGYQGKIKGISDETMSRVRGIVGAKKKEKDMGKLEEVLEKLKGLRRGDTFMSKSDRNALKGELGKYVNEPMRVILKKYGIGDIFEKKKASRILKLIPTKFREKYKIGLEWWGTIANIKDKHPLLKKSIGELQYNAMMTRVKKRVISKNFGSLLKKAYRSRSLLKIKSTRLSKRKVWNNVFDSIEGKNIKLNKQEEALKSYVQNYFNEAKRYLIKNGDMKKGRKNYITHRERDLKETIQEEGLLNGLKTWKDKIVESGKKEDIDASMWAYIDNIIGAKKDFRFAKKRTGKTIPTKNLEEIFLDYVELLESKKYLDKSIPLNLAMTRNLMKGRGRKFMEDYLKQVKGRPIDYRMQKTSWGILGDVIHGIVDIQFLLKLGFKVSSAAKNTIGGEAMSFLYNPMHKYMLGKKRFFMNPNKTYKILSNYGFLDGDYIDMARVGKIGSSRNIISEAAFFPMKVAEVQIRGSEVVGLLTRKEFKTGKLSKRRVIEIMDILERTQGVYTAERTPLAAKSIPGRMALQFSRWIITDTATINNIAIQAGKDLKKGKIMSKDIRRLMKALSLFMIGGYLGKEYSRTGKSKAEGYAKTLQEPLRVTIAVLSGMEILRMAVENPTIDFFKSMLHSLRGLSYEMGLSEQPPQTIEIKKGITDTYIGAKRDLEEAGIVEAENAYTYYTRLKKLSKEEMNKELMEIKRENPNTYSAIKKYIKWDENKLTRQERGFSYLSVKDGERAKKIVKYLEKSKNSENDIARLRRAGIISNTVMGQIRKIQRGEKI
jgi:hypothetical protein